jgi:hypothetical protein
MKKVPMMDITASAARYEAWLRQELAGEVVQPDLDRKHARMAEAPFPFLRATYWRWAETILDCCPNLAKAETVLAVGDIHLENFGTWRDADGRLVWGINDYDEAAEMPWPLDLVRLATSGVLAGAKARDMAEALLAGYAAGLDAPGPKVLDQQPGKLRDAVLANPGEAGESFWQALEAKLKATGSKPGARWVAALQAALPPAATIRRIARRTAGTGSLGRPRWVALAEWRGGLVAREAKAMVASGWVLPPGRGHRAIRSQEAATGAFRVPDPWYAVASHIAVRRLSPSNRKIEVAKDPKLLLGPAMLAAMGHELASLHRASHPAKPLAKELAALPGTWLKHAAEGAAEMTERDHLAWRTAHG